MRYDTGSGHTHRTAAWNRATWALLGLLGAVLVTDLINGGLRLSGAGYPTLLATGLLWVAAVVGTIGMVFVWNNQTRLLAEAHHANPKSYVWSLSWHLVAVVPMLTAILTLGRDADDRATVLGLALRAVVILVVLAGVLVSRARVLRLVRDSAGVQGSAQTTM
ncbi:hypothetical protein BJY16_009104 [Actinoplanes octamycinicus]|uniref:Uncharacterized protein n=1 Tax=Actinoplanes octamycinicus TaxID=135948 RepID=A0A7W7H7U9_9ACTN|nr:hypothetical protein [Actinoplanes octamycinicus]MBB4745645.1 hypothetical protein [Actinoplanes octamycinicus]GIE56488.1 hypothetical protein Aoc01nite_18900 [Actinoplanes octamycinicus]